MKSTLHKRVDKLFQQLKPAKQIVFQVIEKGQVVEVPENTILVTFEV